MTPGPALAALLDGLDVGAVPDVDAVEVLRAGWRQVSHSYALYLAAMAEVGQRCEHPEWGTCEIEAALTFTGRRADYEFAFAQMLVGRLPMVFAALRVGEIAHHKARVFADHLADLSAAQIEHICGRLVPRASGWTTGQLAARLLREIHAVDRHHTRKRYQRALLERGVSGMLAPDGTATITAHGLTPTEAAAAADRLDALAAAVRRAGDPGSIGQVRADLFVRLLDGRYNGFTTEQIITAMLGDTPNRPDTPNDGPAQDDGAAAPPAGPSAVVEGARHGVEVRIGLETLLGLDDHPAERPGWGPVLAEDARLLVQRQHGAEWCFGITDDEGYLRHGGVTRTRPPSSTGGACRGGTVEIHVSAVRLAGLTARPDLPARWVGVVADLARQHTDWRARPGDRDACRLDEHPGSRYARIGLRRHIRLRDRTCVAPGCRWPARRTDQDHTRDHVHGGPTVRANLGPLCERHHLMKHHGGWTLEQPRSGRFRWCSPLHQIYRTRGDPIAPDLPEPVPRDPPDHHGPGRTYDGPIFPPATTPRGAPDLPARRDAGPEGLPPL